MFVLLDSTPTTTAPWSGSTFLIILACVMTLRFYRNRRRSRKAAAGSVPRGKPAAFLSPNHPLIIAPGSAKPSTARQIVPIETVRDLMGDAPRKFDSSLKQYLQVSPPSWLKSKEDEMFPVYAAQERLRRDGKVVWAASVQANSMIYRPGPLDHGASVIWSEDPYFDQSPSDLATIAQELFALKGTDQADPESAAFSRMLTNEMIRAPRLKVPKRFTDGRAVYHSSLMLTRKHLPQGYLTKNLMPVWIDPQPTGMVLLVPAAYWPASLTAWWKESPAPLKKPLTS